MQHEVSLHYTPEDGPYHISASQQYIYVIESGCTKLHVHCALTGQHLGCFTQQQLGLKDRCYMWSVSYGEGEYLHMWVYDINNDTYNLQAYHIA